ncbi:MAG: hypothetical protein ACXWVJ_03595 [Caulobacteraceae bacterium]
MTRPLSLAYQLTYSYNFEATPSPDGKKLVFIKLIGGRQQVFVINADGSGEAQLTRADADHEGLAWSPDGGKIAYVLIKDGHKVVHVMNSNGSEAEAITPDSVKALHPSWSPDGRRILYCSEPENGRADIFAIDVRSKAVTTLVTGGVNTFAVISPDGSQMAFRKILGENNAEVFVAAPDGSNPRNITNHVAYEGWPAWSPDGNRIAFSGNRNANYQIFIMDADGSNVRTVANTEGRATFPKWSPDGRTIYFTNCVKKDYGRGCEIMMAPLPDA